MKKFLNKISESINPENIRLILPENNLNINKAKKELEKIGFQLISIDKMQQFEDFFIQARKLKFSKGW